MSLLRPFVAAAAVALPLGARVVVAMSMIGPWGGFYGPGFYGGGFYAVPDVTQYQVASVETNVYSVPTRTLVWAATTQTVDPGTVTKEAPNYANIIIAQLQQRGLVPGAPAK